MIALISGFLGFVGLFISYILLSLYIQQHYYIQQTRTPSTWKTQPRDVSACQSKPVLDIPIWSTLKMLFKMVWKQESHIPNKILDSQSTLEHIKMDKMVQMTSANDFKGSSTMHPSNPMTRRHSLHNIFASCNLLLACLFAGYTMYNIMNDTSAVRFHFQSPSTTFAMYRTMIGVNLYNWFGIESFKQSQTSLNFVQSVENDMIDSASIWACISDVVVSLIIAVIYENVVEYYWHILMHTPYCYKKFHKYHHYYTSPAPFDDMFIHPLEAFGYYCILWGPAFFLSQHWSSFLIYMTIMGITGILDHCGVHFDLPNLYNTRDHDAHHQYFNVNYGFPSILLDILHGTYYGRFCGRQFIPKYKSGLIMQHMKLSNKTLDQKTK